MLLSCRDCVPVPDEMHTMINCVTKGNTSPAKTAGPEWSKAPAYNELPADSPTPLKACDRTDSIESQFSMHSPILKV